MKTFSQLFEVGGRQVRFLFSPVLTTGAVKYFVTVVGLHEGIVNFEMKEARPASWRVLHPAPQWIQTLEAELGRLLNTKNYLVFPGPPTSN